MSLLSSSQEKTQTKQNIYNGVKINDCDITPSPIVLEIPELYLTLKYRCNGFSRPPDMQCLLFPVKQRIIFQILLLTFHLPGESRHIT